MASIALTGFLEPGFAAGLLATRPSGKMVPDRGVYAMTIWTEGPKQRHKARVLELLIALFATLCFAPANAGSLEAAALQDGELSLRFSGPVGEAEVIALEAPHRIAIDIAGAEPGSVAVSANHLVSRMRQGRIAGGALRIVLDLNRPASISGIDRAPDGQAMTIAMQEASAGEFAATVRAGRRSFAALLPGAPTMAWARREERRYQVSVPIGAPRGGVTLPRIYGPADTSLPLVVVDAGHGGHDPGAISPDGQHREEVVTLAIARAIRDELVATGRVRVALTRDSDQYLVLEERYGIARRLRADLFISVHADAAENHSASGASIYTLSEVASDREAQRLAARENLSNVINGVDLGTQTSVTRSILIDLTQRETMNRSVDFARTLQRAAGSDIPFRTSGLRHAGFVVLKAPDMPSVLLETGFISNSEDASRIASVNGQRAIARGIRRGVLAHFARQTVRDEQVEAGGGRTTARP